MIIQNKTIGIISANYYTKISNCLVEKAIKYLTKHNYKYEIIEVHGAFEIPSALKFLYNLNKFDGFILLGCIIKGETSHGKFISQAIFNSILDLIARYDIAVGLGILTVNNMQQAIERADKQSKGEDAAIACLQMVGLKNRTQ